ncbi:hypothetical protein NPIL_103131 [Nephila pilipes]|uniref:Uncharacterized protein n=1 Tax=Nephila pilipes TaxID=299642 RepID=A0A8X6NUR3_NEPPI|nr:hypothetical protein NPIL_103131 [Nephila pilipes]
MSVESRPRKLKTQNGFLQAVFKEMDGLDIPSWIEPLMTPINSLEASKILYHLDLMSHVLKAQDCFAVLFSEGRKTIYNRFHLEAWLHIYTDGSKLEMNGVAGAGVYGTFSPLSFVGNSQVRF